MEVNQFLKYSCLISLPILASTSYASGFRIPEASAFGTGTSNALVANSSDVGALPYNPAGMSFHTGNAISANVININYELSVLPTGGSQTESTGKDTFYLPGLYFLAKDAGPWSFGLAVNSPFGLETRWPSDTFPNFASVDAREPETSRIQMLNINPNFSYKLDESTSIAFGIDYYDVSSLIFNTQTVNIEGSGSDFGWNIALLKQYGKLSLGLSYRSSVLVDLKGYSDTTAAGGNIQSVTAAIEFPDMLQAGISYQFSKLSVEFDVEHTGWSSFDRIRVVAASGATVTTTTNNWNDAWAYRLGVIMKLSDATKLAFGYAYDRTPQPIDYFSARVPDNDRHLYSAGVSMTFGNWVFDAAYMYVKFDDRTISSSASYNPAASPAQEPNGTVAYNGTYEASVNVFSLGIARKF